MKVLLSWLNDYVKIDDLSVDFISDKLLNIGFEVEKIVNLGENYNLIKTGKILSISKHTNSDKLDVCEIDLGDEKLTLVTGAKNIKICDIVPVALKGALVNGKTIGETNFKGVISSAMLCSLSELNIPHEITKNYQKSDKSNELDISLDKSNIENTQKEKEGVYVFENDTPLGEDISKIFLLDDYVLDISITANRPDCQSVYGIARELSVALNRKLKPLDLTYKFSKSLQKNNVKITIKSKDLCSKYLVSHVENVKICQSPQIIRFRLWACGHSVINNIVDITNYVLTEVGQPMHAFDAQQVDEIIVRESVNGEKIKALDGVEYTLKNNLVIADSTKPIAIAGVMGGDLSAINPSTNKILLESARFSRGHVRLSSRALGISSDSSKRFEKGVDFWSVKTGLNRALSLIYTLNLGEIVTYDDEKINDNNSNQTEIFIKKIETSMQKINDLLGINIDEKFALKTLESLGFLVQKFDENLQISVPLFREDIDNYTDIAEEIIRFYGYDKLNENPIDCLPMTMGGVSKKRKKIEEIEQICLAFNCFEVKNFSFIGENHYDLLNIPKNDNCRECIKIQNPLGKEYSLMRNQLLSGVLFTAKLNYLRQNRNLRIFEIDNIFLENNREKLCENDDNMPIEKKTLCAVFLGDNESFYTIKNLVNEIFAHFKMDFSLTNLSKPYYHPNLCSQIVFDGQKCGEFGKIHPKTSENFELNDNVFALELNLTPLINSQEKNIKFSTLPKFPSVERDLALVVSQKITVGQIFSSIHNQFVSNIELKEIYQGKQIEEGKKSVLVRITLQNMAKTMTEQEINEIMNEIIQALKEKFNAQLRQ